MRESAGHNDGTTLNGYASYSGFGAKLWLPTLNVAGFQAVLSEHMHSHRLDGPTDEMPVLQFVGGGPQPENATLTVVDTTQHEGHAELDIHIVDLDGKILNESIGQFSPGFRAGSTGRCPEESCD